MELTDEMLSNAVQKKSEEFRGEGAEDGPIIKGGGDANAQKFNPPPEEVIFGDKHRIMQQTLAIIKPDAMDKADEIINVLRREGLAILQVY
jgi:hypothetical protein